MAEHRKETVGLAPIARPTPRFAKKLRALLSDAKLRQADLSRALPSPRTGKPPMSSSHVSEMCSGKDRPGPATVRAAVEFFNTRLEGRGVELLTAIAEDDTPEVIQQELDRLRDGSAEPLTPGQRTLLRAAPDNESDRHRAARILAYMKRKGFPEKYRALAGMWEDMDTGDGGLPLTRSAGA